MTEVYIIRPGDSLSRIAKRYSTSLKGLMSINPQIADPDVIYAGQLINVPAEGSPIVHEDDSESDDFADAQWMSIASDELDESEIPGAIHNPRIVEYHQTTSLKASDDETPWCSSFVNWCIEQSGIEGTDSAAARSWLRWGKKLTSPRKGCIVVFSRPPSPTSGHVGFFDRISSNHIVVLGGNQSNAVNYSSYPKSRLLGYRWPS